MWPTPVRAGILDRVQGLRLATVLAALALAASAAVARADRPDPDADDQDDFWGAVLAPHRVEVAELLDSGRQRVLQAHASTLGRGDPRYRAQRLREASAAAARIRALDPRAPALDLLLGLIADESGRAATAERHLRAFALRTDPGQRTEALLALGRIALARHDAAAAIAPLRQAYAEQRNGRDRAVALTRLAQALDDSGDLDGAIALLAGALERGMGPGEVEDNAIWLALIAAYDRDEQVSAALELVDRMKSALGTEYLARLTVAIEELPPTPLAAAWYQRALAYETADQLVPARAAWTTYLGLAPAARYQARARAHVEAIDAILSARRTPAPRRPPPRTP